MDSTSGDTSGSALYTIADIEASTGISKETLRAWERRYGFPAPVRDTAGERLYTSRQLQDLRDAKRLIERGARPGELFASGSFTSSVQSPLISPAAAQRAVRFSGWLTLLSTYRIDELAAELTHAVCQQGFAHFTVNTLAPLVQAVGEAWEAGHLSVACEHLFTARVAALMQAQLAISPALSSRPSIVCASLRGERHGLGLLMAQAMLTAQGLRCLDFGVDLPLAEVAIAVNESRADIVMLSFSAHFPSKQVPMLLSELSAMLPAGTEIWAGGSGARGLRPGPGIRVAQSLEEIASWVAEWRFVHPPQSAAD